MSEYCSNCYLLEEQVAALEAGRNLEWNKGYSQGRDDAHEHIEKLKKCMPVDTLELLDRVAALEAENTDSKREAESLAMALWRRHYREISPDFELCDSTAGVITQIDNMSAGLSAKVEELTYLVTELDAHEGAEGWSTYLELRLKKWRNL